MFDHVPDSYSKAGVSIFSPSDREVIVPLLYFWDFYVSAGDHTCYSPDMLALPAIKRINQHVTVQDMIFESPWSSMVSVRA